MSHKADIFRYYLLEKYGGVWVDATVIPGFSVKDWVKNIANNNLFMFRDPGKDRLISNWLIYSSKNSFLMAAWYKETRDILMNYGAEPVSGSIFIKKVIAYSLMKISPALVSTRIFISFFKVYPYFISHYIFSRLVRRREFRVFLDAMPYESAAGPHILQRYIKSAGEFNKRDFLKIYKAYPVHKLDWKSQEAYEEMLSFVESIKIDRESGFNYANFQD